MKEKFKKLILKICYKFGRKEEIKLRTTKIGKIIEKKDRIVCYANNKILNKKFKNYTYRIELTGIRTHTEEQKKLAKFYDLDKPTYYIFKNITFDSPLKITVYSNNAHIIFKHCTFKGNVIIEHANDIKFISNKYEDNGYYNGYYSKKEKTFIRIKHCKRLQVYNENFTNTKEDHHPGHFGIKVDGAETIEIVDTNMNIDNTVKYKGEVKVPNRGEISIKAQILTMKNSTLESPEIYIEADNIIYEHNKVAASNGIIIENKNNDLVEIPTNITTPFLVYNGVEVTEISEKAITTSKKEEELKKSRATLTSTLRTIENKAININEEVLSAEREKLKNMTLKRVLKR